MQKLGMAQGHQIVVLQLITGLDREVAMELHAFLDEDKPMLERIQRTMGGADLMSLKPVMLPGDAGAIRVRRLLDKLIADESGAAR